MSLRRFAALRLIALWAILAGFGTLRAQPVGYQVPDGRRHFIVLFDTSASMWGSATKRRSLDRAVETLAQTLFEGGALKGVPRYRQGKDLLSVVHFGFDRSRDHHKAYERLRTATLGIDYVRPLVSASASTSRESFVRTFQVSQADKTNINALAWAIPLGLNAARLGSGVAVQKTYVILVNDAQLNDGSLALERFTLGVWLGDAGHARLEQAERAQSQNVRLTNGQGAMIPLASAPFGSGRNLISVSAFEAQSVPSMAKAGSLSKLRPLEGAGLDWVSTPKGTRLEVTFDVPKELRDRKASLSAAVEGSPSVQVDLSARTSAVLPLSPDFAGETVKLVLRPQIQATNELLGAQTFTIPFEEPVRLPNSDESSAARRGRLFWWLVLVGGVVGGAVTFYRHGWLLSHFAVRLPGFAGAFPLAPLSQTRSERLAVRLPVGEGDAAFWLVAPTGWIRRAFYARGHVEWDGRLAARGYPADTLVLSLAELPETLELIWRERPEEATTAKLAIERRLLFFPVHRSEVIVRFSALPRLSPNRRIPDVPSTSR